MKESVKEQQEGFIQLGAVTKRVEIDQVVDETYVKYALRELGTVPCKECP